MKQNIFDLLASALILEIIFILLAQAHNSKIIPWVFISLKQLKSYAVSMASDLSSILPNVIDFQFLPPTTFFISSLLPGMISPPSLASLPLW